ncbi:MAG: FecR domain-containing protein [Paludibacteraceae bacterium]|nr:FecR domain-containing protein [Paludibacteraceae bacterium]
MEEFYQIAQQYFRGTISAADEVRLSAWLKEADKNQILFHIWEDEWRKQARSQASAKTQAAWEKLKAQTQAQQAPIIQSLKPQQPTIRPLRRFYYAAAAVALLVFGVALWLLVPTRTGEAFIAQTAEQETQDLALKDGTEITLNPSSSLAYAADFGKKTREVLFEGEAKFSVAKDAERPFIIRTGDFSVTVLGTEFILRAYSTDSIYTLQLTSGKVKVQYLQDSLFAETGDLVQFNTVTKQFRKKLEANNILLSDLVNRLERLYDVRIEVGDTALAHETLYISINTDDSFEDVCGALEMLLPVVIEKEEDHYRLAAQ